MYFKGEKALNRLLTHKYRRAEVGLEKWVGMNGQADYFHARAN